MRNSKRVFAFLLAVSIVLALPVAVSAAGGIPGEQQGGSLDITGGGTVVIPPTTGNNSYVITVEAGPGGTVDPVGTVQVAKGADKTIAVESLDCGYGIVDVLVDGKSVGAVESTRYLSVSVLYPHWKILRKSMMKRATADLRMLMRISGMAQIKMV